MRRKRCPYCGYEWTPRKQHPKACPHCKRYLVKSSSRTQRRIYKQDKEQEVIEIMKQELSRLNKQTKKKQTPSVLILTQELDKNPPNTIPASKGKKLKIHRPLSYILR